jgi:hypothetical protein
MNVISSLQEQTSMLEFIIANKVARQWWYALVGSDTNTYPFMDHALSNYSSILYFEKIYGRANADAQIDLHLKMPYQVYRLLGGVDNKVDRKASDFATCLEYAALVYGKGALFFNALREHMGQELFLKFLRKYVSTYAFCRVQPEDLIAVAVQAGGQNKYIHHLYERWMHACYGDEDIGMLDSVHTVGQFMQQLQKLQGFHNVHIPSLPPAIMELFEHAIDRLAGP